MDESSDNDSDSEEEEPEADEGCKIMRHWDGEDEDDPDGGVGGCVRAIDSYEQEAAVLFSGFTT